MLSQIRSASAIRGVLFDAVGTLIEPLPSVSEAYELAARRQGIELGRDLIRARFYKAFSQDESDEQRGPLSTSEEVERRRWSRIVERVLPELPDPSQAFQELWDHFQRSGSWRIFPEVTEALAILSDAGIGVRIASNFDGRLRSVVEGLPGLADYSDRLVISSEVGYRKPHRAFYEAGCLALGMEKEEVLCVGDDLENDVHGPRAAGLRAILVDRQSSRGDGYRDLATLVRDLVAGTLNLDTSGDR